MRQKTVNLKEKMVDIIESEKLEMKSIIHEEKIKKPQKKKIKCEITDFNTYLFHEGRHYESHTFMGAHIVNEKKTRGVRFTTWAPNSKNVYVVGDFSNFQVREEYRMERITSMGIWSLFISDIEEGTKYKYSIEDVYGNHNYKADPYGFVSELRPNTASIIFDKEKNKYKWNDRSWMTKRRYFNMYESPVNVYEIHLGSWKRENGEFLSYSELAEKLPQYVREMGYTHVELMPIMEHPLDASWGYQGVGYFSTTSRYGDRNGFKKLIDEFHKSGIGVILDWVPGHFCKDAHGLYRFDGTPTYEYSEAWKAENKGWGTCNFDLGRPEVKSFLISNAIYWFREFHIDGLRVDAVSNMLYLDYGREYGSWTPNIHGGNGNLEAIDFIKILNTVVSDQFPTVMMIAEESTSWPKISKPIEEGGLGFNFKWNMGWMHDTLAYVKEDPIYRSYNHNKINFSMFYHYSENFILSISHDEVVHGKGSLVNKMWGDTWNKFAGLRLYAAHMIGHPGKKLMFMGSEFGQFNEWQEYRELDWNLLNDSEISQKTQYFFKSLNKFYTNNKSLWQLDYQMDGYQWIDADNKEKSIYSFIRKGKEENEILIFVCNYTSKVNYDFRIGVPFNKEYIQAFNTDEIEFGGSGQVIDEVLVPEEIAFNNQPYSIKIKVPPMATIVLSLNKINKCK